MNTTVFAEEVAVDSVDEAVEATVDAVDAAEEATVDAAVDAVVAAEGDVTELYNDGIFYKENKDGTYDVITTIKYDSNGDVATITNTTDPISWNNAYGRDLIATVLYGDNVEDSWLNNGSTVTVSKNDPDFAIPELRGAYDYEYFKVIPVVGGSQYLFVGYDVEDSARDYVAGYDDAVETYKAVGHTHPDRIPVATWDGRTIDFNKSGIHKFTTSKKEALDVAVAFVTYNNGVVQEVNGIEVGSVKVDKKNQKAASVEYDVNPVSKTYTGYKWNVDKGELETASCTMYIAEHNTMGDLPFFTIKAKVKGTDAKSYKKDVAGALKDQKFYFGIQQRPVNVKSELRYVNDAYSDVITDKHVGTGSVSGDDLKKVSANDFVDVAAKAIEKDLVDYGAYSYEDTDAYYADGLKITKFNESKGTATVTLMGYVGDDYDDEYTELKTLSGKGNNAEYTFEDGKLAGTSVKVLNFKEGGNFVYAPLTLSITDDEKGTTTRVWTTSNPNSGNFDLAPVGFKYAFRQSPVEKSKKFRGGIYAQDNGGFVFSVEDAATDSVEEAF